MEIEPGGGQDQMSTPAAGLTDKPWCALW
jgi:hypothetical protein